MDKIRGTIQPGIVLKDGTTYHPEGWMWVLMFALREIPWALKEIEKPEFQRAVDEWRHKIKLEEVNGKLKN